MLEPIAGPPTLADDQQTDTALTSNDAPNLVGDQPSEVVTADLPEESESLITFHVARAKLERANRLHRLTLATLDTFLRSLGLTTWHNAFVDMFGRGPGWTAIFEAKSITPNNQHSQVRAALSQLLEYRYNEGMLGADMFLVLSSEPSDYRFVHLLNHVGIHTLWVAESQIAGPGLPKIPRYQRN